MYAVGLMSGTSLDGVDACLVEVKRGNKFKIVDFIYLPYEKEFKEKILNISTNKSITIQKVCSLNVEISKEYVEACTKLFEKSGMKPSNIAYIAMHGQTVWHNPNNLDGYESSTLQLGDPSILASAFNCKVISNFRMMDMAVGGSGAPLVPYANYVIYHSKTENVAVQNIGGIGNVTYLKKNGKIKDIIAFDTGPGNMLIDGAMSRLFGRDYDDNGQIAKSGRIIQEILNQLLNDPYLEVMPPKSTGREKYNEDFLSELLINFRANNATDADIITTLTEFTVSSICLGYKRFLGDIDKLIVSGGGALNGYIVERLKELLPCKVEIDYRFDRLEALSFAILGYQTLKGKPSNVPSVTNASTPAILGNITYPNINKKY